jgi:hypothetical protein
VGSDMAINPRLLLPVDNPEQTQEVLDGIDLEALTAKIAVTREKILKQQPLTLEEEREIMIWARTLTGRTFASVHKEKPVKAKAAKVSAPKRKTELAVKKEQTANMSALDLLNML